jgi:transposase InsO family protein
MPWKESSSVTERMKFVSRLIDGERMTDLCREFGISRKTGHKIWNRYRRVGLEGLRDQSRRPWSHPSKTPREVVLVIVAGRRRYGWGPRKLKDRLQELHPGVRFPAASTIGVILADEGLVKRRKRRRRATPTPTPLTLSSAANDVWGIDFKGQFRLGNKKYCYPLTVSDLFSRYLLGCEAMERISMDETRFVMEEVFIEHGLPNVIRSDNGTPFASAGVLGLTKLSVWFLRQGIRVERIEPGHPEQNGRHERIHRTLKEEATRPPGPNLLKQQEQFDKFRERYNEERPHEALDMRKPATVYATSSRRYEPCLEPLEYPMHDHTCSVRNNGTIHVPLRHGPEVYVGNAFTGENLGIREVSGGTWLVSFMDMEIGYIDVETKKFLPRPTLEGTPEKV